MKTIEHFKKLHSIVREKSIRSALVYDSIETAKRHPRLARLVARFYCDGFCEPIRFSHENGSIRALPDYTGRLAIFEIN